MVKSTKKHNFVEGDMVRLKYQAKRFTGTIVQVKGWQKDAELKIKIDEPFCNGGNKINHITVPYWYAKKIKNNEGE